MIEEALNATANNTGHGRQSHTLSISALACIVQDVLHEGLGHGVMAWFSGAHKITISTVAMQSDFNTRAISAAGTVVSLIAAAIFWLTCVIRRAIGPRHDTFSCWPSQAIYLQPPVTFYFLACLILVIGPP